MTSFNVEFWLVLQMVVEVLICIVIGYYFYREKSKKEDAGLEKEKIKVLMDSLNRFVAKSEDLDRKHQKVLKLWEKIERKGEEIEAYIDYYERKLKSAPEANNVGDGSDSVESGVACYEKTSRLIENGLSAGEIAQTVGLPQGEVELIMNLKRQ